MPISRGACREFLEEFSSFVDGKLDARRRSLLLAHLDCCEACLRHLRAYRKGVAAFREAESSEPVWGMYDRVVERLEEEPARAGEAIGAGYHAAGPGLGAVGAALVMALLALFVLVPQTGRIDSTDDGGPHGGSPATEATTPTSWASVIPSALPLAGIGQGATDGLRSSAAPARSRTVRSDLRLAIGELPEVPRREVRVARLDDLEGSIPAGGFSGWPRRRPPIVIDREATIFPATWVAEAALRIP